MGLPNVGGQEWPPHETARRRRGSAVRQISEFTRRKRRLPHWEGPGETYFLRFSLLHPSLVDLTRPDVAPIIIDALRFHDNQRYWLYDYTVMPDHVHAILKPVVRDGKTERLGDITGSLKGFMAYRINRLIGRSGNLWQDETYNHIIRDEREYHAWAKYILENAQARGLIDDPTQWPWWGRGSGDGP